MQTRNVAIASLIGLLLLAIGAQAEGSNWEPRPPQVVSRQLKVSRVTLNAEQIQALSTTPVVLVSAPGQGRVIRVESMTMSYVRGAIDFGGSDVIANIQYSTDPDLTGDIAWTEQFEFFLQIASQFRIINPIGLAGTGAGPEFTTQVVNQPVTFSTSSALSDGDGSLRVTTLYDVVTP